MDDHDITFKEFQDILVKCLDGSISKEPYCELKTDGQNLMISYKDGDFIFARTKKHLRDSGKSSLKSIDELSEYLNKIPGEVIQNFRNAAIDMVSALSKINKVLLVQIFKEGLGWLSFEVINPLTKNVFDYLQKSLYLQSIMIVNEDGIQVEENKKYVEILFDEIEKNKLEHQKQFVIRSMVKAIFNPNPNLDKNIKMLDDYLKNFKDEYKLKDTNTFSDYLKIWWERYINHFKPTSVDFSNDEIEVLIDRFVNNKVDLKLTDFEKYYGKTVLDWIKSVDEKTKKINYDSMESIRFINDEIGYIAIGLLKTHLSSDPEKTTKIFNKDFKEKIEWIQSLEPEDKNFKKFNENFELMTKHRKPEDITMCEEGFTFFRDGIIYKMTGYFSIINQLFGVGKYK